MLWCLRHLLIANSLIAACRHSTSNRPSLGLPCKASTAILQGWWGRASLATALAWAAQGQGAVQVGCGGSRGWVGGLWGHAAVLAVEWRLSRYYVLTPPTPHRPRELIHCLNYVAVWRVCICLSPLCPLYHLCYPHRQLRPGLHILLALFHPSLWATSLPIESPAFHVAHVLVLPIPPLPPISTLVFLQCR